MKFALLAALPFLLSACGIPTAAIVIGSVDGATFVGTGKSLSSHAISEAAKRDCSILFAVTRGKLCKPREQYSENFIKDAAVAVPMDSPARSQQGATAENSNASTVETQEADRSGGSQTQWTLVLGTFPDYRSAIKLARRVKPDPGVVTAVVVKGDVEYLVSTKPLRRDQAPARQMNIAKLGLKSVRLKPICPSWMRNDTCISHDRPLPVQQAGLPQ